MKKSITVFLLLISLSITAQVRSGASLPDAYSGDHQKVDPNVSTAGSCAAPNGVINNISGPPPSYAWLQANGYCNPSPTYGNNGTVCWSFTASQPSVSFNSGYSTTGCGSISFGFFTLYRCAPICTVVGTGLNFSVTVGQCYTWCLNYNGTGGLCTFNDFCPYVTQTNPLPVELSYFAGSSQGNTNVLQWKTQTELNNDFFVLETSTDASNWMELSRIDGAGTSHNSLSYTYQHTNFAKTTNYYRLKQVDFDGGYKYNGIVVINNAKDKEIKAVRILNILGQEVGEDHPGIKIIYYSDGSIEKKY